MSGAPLRRADKAVDDERAWEVLRRSRVGRLATIGADGWPYCVPLLYVIEERRVWLHGTAVRGHLRANLEHEPRACFEVDEPGPVFPYGRFDCDTTIAFASVVLFGRVTIVPDRDERIRFFDALMAKHADPSWQRPSGFYPRLDDIALYRLDVERISGKETRLPAREEQWPARDRTMSPGAEPPG